MQRSLSFILGILLCTGAYANLKHEFRATWFTTHYAIDWPTTKATSDSKRAQQQKEMTDIFDEMVAGNMNAVCMQVRSLSDATYKSSYEEWASILTGTRGKDPGYDPLAFAVEEAHKRGLELHVWVNPFRVTSSGTISTSDKVWQNAGQWIIKYDNGSFAGQIIDPGFPDARAYVIKVLMEIVNNYDVDGIVMDDYFYPYGGTTTEDAKSKALYKPNNVLDVNKDGDTDDDWRRSNVDVCLKALYDTIQSVKPWVRLGMGTFGIWSTQKKAAEAYGLTLPSGINGLDDYDVQACNPIEWVMNGYVDYINPQLYWATSTTSTNYNVLCEWWAKDVCEHFSNQLPDGKKVHFFISQAAYRAVDGGFSEGITEIQKQITANRRNLSSGSTGSVFYNTKSYRQMASDLAASHFIYKALPPAMDWKSKTTLAAPSDLTVSGHTVTWQHPTAERFTVYVYPKGLDFSTAQKDAQYLHRVVYGKSCEININNLEDMTIAVCTYDRFGMEHQAALWNEGKFPDSDPNATEIIWVMNGGVLKEIVTPTNEELWEKWKPDYVAFYTKKYGNTFKAASDRAMNDVLGYTWINSVGGGLAAEFMTEDVSWKWLTDYMLSVAEEQDKTISEDNGWRYNLYSFFNCTNAAYRVDGYCAGSTVDFTEAGLPEKWGEYYPNKEEADMQLPSQVTETYILPTPIHPDGHAFLGWYTTATIIDEPIIAIPAGWKGTLYAHWEGLSTSVEEVLDLNQSIQIYDVMGRPLGSDINQLQGNIFIIKQGSYTFKLIR
jgi:uncharacterized lipoprotein YddW (UPF0748 family)